MTDADLFFERVEAFLVRVASELGLGTAKGRFDSPVTGPSRTITVFGPFERLWLVLVCEAKETWLAFEQTRLRWYAGDAAESLPLDRLPGRPLQTRVVRGMDDLERDIRLMLGFFHGKDVEEVIEALGASTAANLPRLAHVRNDPDNDPS